MGKSPGKSSSNKIINYVKQETALGQKNSKAACPKDMLDFKFSFESWKTSGMSTFSLLYTVANGWPGTNDRQKTNDEEHLTTRLSLRFQVAG